MKSCKYTDKEIADFLGLSIRDFLDTVESDTYIKEVYEQAGEKVASEIESKFLTQVIEKLDSGDTLDAKWVLERTNSKYQKKEQLEINHKGIDEIIREKEDEK